MPACATSSTGSKPSGRLVRVKAPVSPYLEMTEIQTRLLAEGGPAVLFEKCHPRRRRTTRCRCWSICSARSSASPGAWTASRTGLREVGETLAFLKQPEPPGGWREALEMLPLLQTVMAMRPKTVGAAPCQEIVLDAAATSTSAQLPIQTCWPGEPAPLITWPLVVTKGPGRSAARTISISASTACR